MLDRLLVIDTETTGLDPAADVAIEVGAVIYSLQHRTSCVSTRWTAIWETTKLDAKGKKQIEECRIRVLDTESGGDRDGSLYSGGERAMLDLGCSLALTMYACKKLGIERPTLVRDETDAGMTEENSHAMIPMLRRAAEFIGADKVLVISHRPQTIEQADSRILVADGRVEVQA